MKHVIPFSLIALALGCTSCSTIPQEAACCKAPLESVQNAPLSQESLYHLESTWTSQEAKTISLDHFKGSPVLLTMFFSNCEYACPILVEKMRSTVEQLSADDASQLQKVLISFDVERDTPAVLKKHAIDRGLSNTDWTLLHGSADDVLEIAAVLGIRYRQEKNGSFAHSNIITLLDRDGSIAYQLKGLESESEDLLKAIKEVCADSKR